MTPWRQAARRRALGALARRLGPLLPDAPDSAPFLLRVPDGLSPDAPLSAHQRLALEAALRAGLDRLAADDRPRSIWIQPGWGTVTFETADGPMTFDLEGTPHPGGRASKA